MGLTVLRHLYDVTFKTLADKVWPNTDEQHPLVYCRGEVLEVKDPEENYSYWIGRKNDGEPFRICFVDEKDL